MTLLVGHESAEQTESSLCGQAFHSHPIVILVSTAAVSLMAGFLLGVLASRMCRRRSSVSVTSSKVSLVTSPSNRCPDSGSPSTTSMEQCSVGEQAVSVTNVTGKQGRKAESWPRFSYTGTLQKVKRIYL